MKQKTFFHSLLVAVMTSLILFSSCQNEAEQDGTHTPYDNLSLLQQEKNKYETATTINIFDEGLDISDKVIKLKNGESADSRVKVSVLSTGFEGKSNSMLNSKNGKIIISKKPTVWLEENMDSNKIPDNMDIVTLKFEYENQSSTLEVLVVANQANKMSKDTYTLATKSANLKANTIGKDTYLGAGYNTITGSYINRNDAKLGRPILDINKLNAAGAIKQSDVTYSNFNIFTGESMYSFFKSLNVDANVSYGVPLFSGSIKTEFKSTKDGNIITRYAKGRGYHYTKDEWLIGSTNPATLRNYFSNDFLNTIQTASAATILNLFGDHLLVRCYHGGSAEFNYSYSGTSITTDTEFSTSIKASFSFLSGGTSTVSREKITDVQNNSYFSAQSSGGNLTSFVDQATFNAGYSDWVKTVPTKPDLAGIGKFSECLIPIWTLVAQVNTTKANEIKKEFDYRVQMQETLLGNFSTFVTALNVWDMSSTNVPGGYTSFVETDMYKPNGAVLDANRRAKGAYIRIGYLRQQKDSNHDAIADIIVLRGNTATPAGWTKINLDLNRGAKGEYLYLAYRKVNQFDTKAIDFIGSSCSGSQPSGLLLNKSWSWVCFANSTEWADLNKGAKGDYIYLTVHKSDFKW